MNKVSIYCTILSLLAISSTYAPPIHLENPIIKTVDGLSIGITGETVALIKQYQSQITSILAGKRDSAGNRVGLFEFERTTHSVQSLRKLEIERGTNPQFATLLKQIRFYFERQSDKFRNIVHGVKPIMAILIEESCSKRNRLNSLLYVWAKTDEKNEYELFDHHVKSIKDFEIFLTDLYNFLGDLVLSCPQAQQQFKERVKKFSKIKIILEQLNIANYAQQAFLKQINQTLSKLTLKEITSAKVNELINAFMLKL